MKSRPQDVFGRRAGFYATSPVHTEPRLLERLVELAQPQPGHRVLDVGTGAGHTAFALAPHSGLVVATDVTPEMLLEARLLQAEQGIANVDLGLAEASHLPFMDETFDLLSCRRAAHHFVDIGAAILDMKRVLKPGGWLVIDDRSVPENDFVDATMNRLDELHDESHVRQYRPSEWVAMLESAGLSVEHVEPYTRHLPLSSLTGGVEAHRVAEIHGVIKSLSQDQREAMSIQETDGQLHLNHWYVLLSATQEGITFQPSGNLGQAE